MSGLDLALPPPWYVVIVMWASSASSFGAADRLLRVWFWLPVISAAAALSALDKDVALYREKLERLRLHERMGLPSNYTCYSPPLLFVYFTVCFKKYCRSAARFFLNKDRDFRLLNFFDRPM